MRFLKLTTIAALAFAAVACQQDDGGVTVTTVPPLAFVRYINAVPDSFVAPSVGSIRINTITSLPETTFTASQTFTTTLRFVDFLEFTPTSWANVGFRGLGLGGYQGTKAGSRRFKIFTFDPSFFTTAEIADVTHNFEAGKYYTIVHWGTGVRARVIEEPVPAGNAQFQYKVMHLAGGVGNVDVYQQTAVNNPVTGSPVQGGLAELAQTAYQNVALAPALAAQVTAPSSTANVAGTLAPAGGVSAAGLEPFAGSNQAGSVMTAFAFRAQPAVVAFGRTWRAATPASVVWYMDRRPPL